MILTIYKAMMATVVATHGSLIEIEEIENSRESILNLLESQKGYFQSQIKQFHRIVNHQCKLTGSNPLAQDMAASSLGNKTGKYLNPKAMKYLQSVFSIKDTIGKKEARKISSLCGTTVTQVRNFIAIECSKVKKLVKKSENLPITNKMKVSTSFPNVCTDIANVISNTSNVSGSISNVNVDSSDKEFVERILSMMRKEDTFSGWVELMEWVLEIQNKDLLRFFSNRGGITILGLWLNDAALEEQTTVLSVVFKVFCHIPIDKAQPAQMSDILQTVNKLQFYRNPDISKRAKVLLSSWSKMFGALYDKLNIDIPEEMYAFAQNAEDRRGTEPEPGNGLKLLISSSDTLSKKHELSISATKTKEGRKVQMLVEHPDSKSGRNGPIIAKASSSNQSRPNIKKAEMRAIYMQEKHGKAAKSPTEHGQLNDENIPHAVRKPLLNNQAPPTFNAPRVQIQWCRPPEVLLSSSWHVCSGQNSKELHTEIKRTQTRQESIYQTAHQIPPNPKQPWGSEIDYNDALTPVIPIEEHANVTANGTMPAALDFSNVDLDLLKVLLKNPELVEVLTRVEHNLTQEQLVALLEYVKKADSAQPVPISRSASIPRPNLPASNNQGQQPLPLPMQVMYQPNHTNMMSSNNNLENLFPGTVQYPEQLPLLTVPDYSRSEFEMYRRGRGYDQSNLNYGNLNNGNRVGEKRLRDPHFTS